MSATEKKQKPLKRHPSELNKASAYTILTLILISIVAVTFAFPLYWIIEPIWQVSVMGEPLASVAQELGIALGITAALGVAAVVVARRMPQQLAGA